MEKEDDHFNERIASSTSFDFLINPDNAGLRLDHYLVLKLTELSRSQLSQSIKNGDIQVNGSATKASRKLQLGDVVSGSVRKTENLIVKPQKVEFEILYEDEYLLLIAKPPDLVVHPANGNPDMTLVNGLLHYCEAMSEVGDPIRPGIVHRLDKDTSGVMVIAKKSNVHRLLTDIFKSRQVKKTYHALVHGIPKNDRGRINAAIGRHPVNRKKMAVREQGGKYAVTNWTLQQTFAGKYSLLELNIETGRTHQIRVHCASIGHPVAGDSLYGAGRKQSRFPRQMLHSSELRFLHPITNRQVIGSAPIWPDMANMLQKLDEFGEEW